MKITLIPSASGVRSVESTQYSTSFLINDRVAIDAGSLGFHRQPSEQAAVRHVFLSHSHIDHLASLPIFLENIAGLAETPVTVHASQTVQQCLRLDVFNSRLWPNFLELTLDGKPLVVLNTIEDGQTVAVEGLRITAVAVHHTVPTLGFIIEDDAAAVVISADTGPTEAIWQRAKKLPNFKAVFLEATFPNAMKELADISKHLTPADFVREMKKFDRPVPFYAIHLKAHFRDQVAEELLASGQPGIMIAKSGSVYEF